MADSVLENCKVAILATDGFEESELLEPKRALEKAGAEVHVVSLKSGSIKAWDKNDWGKEVDVDMVVSKARPEDFNALMLPGGVMNPDKLRIDDKAIEFIKGFVKAGKPIAAICHGPWTLIEAGAVVGRRMTSWPSLKSDLTNAGAQWVDEEVVTDNGLVTSRKPADLHAFCEKMLEEFAEGQHEPLQRARASKDHRVEGSFH
jgi:protease I